MKCSLSCSASSRAASRMWLALLRSKAGLASFESRLETDQADRDHSVAVEPASVVGLDARVRPNLILIQCQPRLLEALREVGAWRVRVKQSFK